MPAGFVFSASGAKESKGKNARLWSSGPHGPPMSPGFPLMRPWTIILWRYVWSIPMINLLTGELGDLKKSCSASWMFSSMWDRLMIAKHGFGRDIATKSSQWILGRVVFCPNEVANWRLPPATARERAASCMRRVSVSLHLEERPRVEEIPRLCFSNVERHCAKRPWQNELPSSTPPTAAFASLMFTSWRSWREKRPKQVIRF